MYCPKCNAELKDDAHFCSRCGAKIEKHETPPAHEGVHVQTRIAKKPVPPTGRKKKRGLIVLCLLAVLAGGVLGSLYGLGIIQFPELPAEPEIVVEVPVPETPVATTAPTEPPETETSPTPAPTAEPTPPPTPAPTAEPQAHRGVYAGDTLAIIDDKAHLLTPEAIDRLLEKATGVSTESGKCIALVLTNDLFNMDVNEFTLTYYEDQYERNIKETMVLPDGYFVLYIASEQKLYVREIYDMMDWFDNNGFMDTQEFEARISDRIEAGEYESVFDEALDIIQKIATE